MRGRSPADLAGLEQLRRNPHDRRPFRVARERVRRLLIQPLRQAFRATLAGAHRREFAHRQQVAPRTAPIGRPGVQLLRGCSGERNQNLGFDPIITWALDAFAELALPQAGRVRSHADLMHRPATDQRHDRVTRFVIGGQGVERGTRFHGQLRGAYSKRWTEPNPLGELPMSVLVSATDLTKSYTARPLFSGLAFDLRVGEKVGLIGPNGAGKSTLLKILAGKEPADEGNVSLRRGARIGYLAQDDLFPEGQSVEQVVIDALHDLPLEDYEKDTAAAQALTIVGFSDTDQAASKLSGGWRKRLSLARELARKPDFLLLDEPTNHLDLPGVVWLEKLLRASQFGYLVATHDRAFLKAIAPDIMEVNRVYPAGVFRATGGFESFADKKARFLEAQAKEHAALANVVARETDWLAHKAQARTRKAQSRIDDAHMRQASLAELNQRTQNNGPAGIDFVGSGRQTKKLVTAQGITKSLGGKALFGPLDLLLLPGMKLGLLGANGSGKSTFLKVLAGELEPDSGSVVRADSLKIASFEQGRSSLDPTTTLRRALAPNGDMVHYRGRELHVGGWARMFLFQAEQLDLPLSALSGGEQARVRIAQLMQQPADVLFLDEPTNDLDIPALEVLEESLDEFPGAIVLITHDRELLSRVSTEVIGLDGQGGSGTFGSVEQWLKSLMQAPKSATPSTSAVASGPITKAAAKAKKLSYKELQELDGIEAAIAKAEAKVAPAQQVVESASTQGRDALDAACRDLDAANAEVERLYGRWSELESKRAAQ